MARNKDAKGKNAKPGRPEKSRGRSGDTTAPDTRSNLGFYLVLGLLAAAGIVWLILAGGGGSAPESRPISVADMEADASGAVGVTMGPEDAPVTIIEFADFRCPSCRQFNSMTGRLMRQNYATGDDALVRWVAYDFPIFGQASWYPMLAARCADDQGRFWEMHDLLYARTETWYNEANPNGAFVELAAELGLNLDEFRECLQERPHLQDIAASRKYGESLGVSSTPTLYLNGRPVPHTRRNTSYQGLEELALQAAEAAGASNAAATGDAEDAPDE